MRRRLIEYMAHGSYLTLKINDPSNEFEKINYCQSATRKINNSQQLFYLLKSQFMFAKVRRDL